MTEQGTISVLDKGYVRYLDHLGTDLSVVNAARASMAKEKRELTDADRGLLRYLAEGEPQHWMPFAHPKVSLEVRAPLMVINQWYRTAVDSLYLSDAHAWSEMSRRYVTEEPEFYVPAQLRYAPDNKKQGSGADLEEPRNEALRIFLEKHYAACLRNYHDMLAEGVAPEQARLLLPAYALYSTFRWTASLATVARFLQERLPGGKNNAPQGEIVAYAQAVQQLVTPLFPESLAALLKDRE